MPIGVGPSQETAMLFSGPKNRREGIVAVCTFRGSNNNVSHGLQMNQIIFPGQGRQMTVLPNIYASMDCVQKGF